MIRNSDPTKEYNCIAYAYGCDDRWLEPFPIGEKYPIKDIRPVWPDNITRSYSLNAFIELFESIGYTKCKSSELQPGFLKIALYLDETNTPHHAAKQLETGYWASKLGDNIDVIHLLPDVVEYYKKFNIATIGVVYMKRPVI